MSEQEVVEIIYSIFDRYWVITQWWVSVSFLMLAVAHLGADHLNRVTTSLLIALYICFTLWIEQLSGDNTYPIGGYLAHLEELSKTQTLSPGTMMLIEKQRAFDPIFQQIAKFGTFVCAVAYPIYITLRNGRGT